MEKIERHFAAFEKQMHQERIYLDRSVSFEDVCSIIGADPLELDSHIVEELGQTGQSLLDLYRSQEPGPSLEPWREE